MLKPCAREVVMFSFFRKQLRTVVPITDESITVVPRTEIKLTMYVSDGRDASFTQEDLGKLFSNTKEQPYFSVHYDADTDTYSIPDKTFPGLQAILLNKIPKIKFVNHTKGSRYALYQLTKKIIEEVPTTIDGSRMVLSLRIWSPANLGDSERLSVTDELDTLLKDFKPSHLVLGLTHNALLSINADDVLKEDVNAYFEGRGTRIGYTIPPRVEHVIALPALSSDDLIEQKLLEQPSMLRPRPLTALKTPQRSQILGVYIFDSSFLVNSKEMVALCSTTRHEPSICVLHHQHGDLYEVIQINTNPPAKEKRSLIALTRIQRPGERLNFEHFIEFIQVLIGVSYLNTNKLRLFIESSLGNIESQFVTLTTSKLIIRLRPDYLNLLTNKQNEEDALKLLTRKSTKEKYVLLGKHIEGNCIPLSIFDSFFSEAPVKRVLIDDVQAEIKCGEEEKEDETFRDSSSQYKSSGIHTLKSAIKQYSIPPAIVPSIDNFPVTAGVLEDDHRNSTFYLQQLLDINIVPRIGLHAHEANIHLTPRSKETLNDSNKAFRFPGRPSSAPAAQETIHFRDECGLKRTDRTPTFEEQKSYKRSWYIITNEHMFYYNHLLKSLEPIAFDTPELEEHAMTKLKILFDQDVKNLSKKQLKDITTYSRHSHSVTLASSKTIDTDLCCSCVIQ